MIASAWAVKWAAFALPEADEHRPLYWLNYAKKRAGRLVQPPRFASWGSPVRGTCVLERMTCQLALAAQIVRGVHRGVHATGIGVILGTPDPRNHTVCAWLRGFRWAVQGSNLRPLLVRDGSGGRPKGRFPAWLNRISGWWSSGSGSADACRFQGIPVGLGTGIVLVPIQNRQS